MGDALVKLSKHGTIVVQSQDNEAVRAGTGLGQHACVDWACTYMYSMLRRRLETASSAR